MKTTIRRLLSLDTVDEKVDVLLRSAKDIYLAGKIGPQDWRHEIVYDLDRDKEINSDFVWDSNTSRLYWERLENSILNYFHYIGPFFARSHGEYISLTENSHGNLPYAHHNPTDSNQKKRSKVHYLCLERAASADLVVAYIDSPDAYGTICEIYYAYSKGVPIAIFGPYFADMWFVYQCACFLDIGEPLGSRYYTDRILQFLQTVKDNRRIDYYEYILSTEWKLKADEAKKRCGYRCQLCNETGSLHAHHRTYENLGHELPEDITVLCSKCHAKFHDKPKDNKIYRPPMNTV